MEFVAYNIEIIIVGLSLATIITLVLTIYAMVQFRHARRMYKTFMTGTESQNLESHLLEVVSRVKTLEDDRSAQAKTLRDLDRRLSYALQRVGMVRFNAFSDAGGELSYAVALLDSEGNGVVTSSIYGRAEARVYAKSVIRGKSSFNLSQEEESAIAQAMQSTKV